MSSCTTHYPDVLGSGVDVTTSRSDSSINGKRTSRWVTPPLHQQYQRKNRARDGSSAANSVNNQPQQQTIISAPKKVINLAGLNNKLFEASGQGDIDVILYVLGQGADISASNSNGETALHSAAAHSQANAAKILINNGADVNALTISGWSPLHSAARFGSTDVVLVLLRAGANVSQRNTAGRTALSLAKQAQHYDVVRVLKEPLIKPNYF